MIIRLFILFAVAILGSSCGTSLPEDVAAAYSDLPEDLNFNIHVKPVLSDKCFACHGPDEAKQKADLRLDSAEGAFASLKDKPGKVAIHPGNLSKSEVFHRIISDDPEYRMPTPEAHLEMSAYEKAVLIKWIESGATYQPHWAFVKPIKIQPPTVKKEGVVVNSIDQFILKELELQQLKPAPEAEKELLLRRVSLDLTGLPPTPKEINTFLADQSENAYEKQVDRLLASSHYGEKMATDWLDVARYADTHGYLVDRYRDMSPWRDWVINSFNQNQTYDEFLTWQLAGDLLPNPTKEQILATGFNRLHPQNLEGGIIDEEFRVEYVADRVDVASKGLMGLTYACARCHDHKYDPISQKNYYELFSFFNNINESGQIPWDWAIPVPTLMIPTEKQEQILSFLDQQVAVQEENLQSVIKNSKADFDNWLKSEAYQKLILNSYPKGLLAHVSFEGNTLVNSINPKQKGKMDRKASKGEQPTFTEGLHGTGLLLDGEAWLDLDKIGIFKRSQPFSIGLNVYIPKDLKTGVLFHKGMGTGLHSYRGYHLHLKDNRLELLMAHTWPDNAIVEHTSKEAPKDRWIQFTVSYDGSSKASGYKLYLDGKELSTKVETDNLYKDIIFRDFEDYIYPETIEPGLQVGARWRGKGLGGAIVDDIIVYDRELSALEVLQIGAPESVKQLLAKSSSSLSTKEVEFLKQFYLSNYASNYQKALKSLAATREVYVDSIENVQEVMVMKEMPEQRKAYVLERGQYDVYGEEVFPNTPKTILPMAEGLPKNRLGLAQWLTSPEHPLTARVAVNRYWQNYFGRGIVRTTEDFGNQGELPSHSDLLDWLAITFVESGWDVKALQKLMVMSATYRQSSLTSPELRERDPDNIYLARGPSARLSSEMLRDNVLAASELINKEIGGESVYPYQPEGLWKMNNAEYIQDKGDKLYRRSLYTIWKRSVPHPTLSTFDSPDRSECTVRRQKTNTPLQALVLLNDPAYLEAAKVIGSHMSKIEEPKEAITTAFLKLTGRSPKQEELKILVELQQHEYQKFKNRESETDGWLSSGAYAIEPNTEAEWVAANAVVASAIINTDATITKR